MVRYVQKVPRTLFEKTKTIEYIVENWVFTRNCCMYYISLVVLLIYMKSFKAVSEGNSENTKDIKLM